ncbi:MAG TPA: hypothetical protein ENG83_12460 [Nitrospirae bacterium]|nr:serine dehydrogenase proteinase [bacterium BMS3Abin06]HDH12989.1 hypothetical protein [Nitrospirota bacterium]HDZ00393.1 hypothetical protein [Nitrospirota bacterium]
MSDGKEINLSVEEEPKINNDESKKDNATSSVKKEEKKVKIPSWREFVKSSSVEEVKNRFIKEAKDIVSKYNDKLSNYCFISMLDPESSITSWDLDKIFNALSRSNAKKEKDILLMILSSGGSIEPAYQISKLCKSFSKDKFVVSVPRQAKSAATLIAIGADEIHMGPLGQLGPIDPQLGGLPALGVTQALKFIASLSERFPGSAEMFARYLTLALTVEQIGYCERISESASQYAERLLLTKTNLAKKASHIARELVYEYKDHGFVIDLDEARQHLGDEWILSDTPEASMTEEIYGLFEEVNLFLDIIKEKRLLLIGTLDDVLIFNRRR